MEALEFDWNGFWSRPNQRLPSGDWRTWLILAGRGFGKTRTGAETVRLWSDKYSRMALVAPTAKDVRDVMVEGESGILAKSPAWNRPLWQRTLSKLTWPNGAVAFTYSADEPERLRGPQHDAAWCDELAAWRYPEAWDQLMFGMRLGVDPRTIITTTPRPTELLRSLMKAPTTHVTRASTYENRSNLAPDFLRTIVSKYEGTRIGRQELLAEMLDDVPGALWTREMIDKAQSDASPGAVGRELARVVVGIDPATSANEGSDETGIVVDAVDFAGHGWCLADLSMKGSPREWAQRAVNGFWHFNASLIVAEANNGGDMVRAVIAQVDPRVPVQLVHASRGKIIRAEPIAALYEQGRFHHVRTAGLDRLEDQMCSYAPGMLMKSPDRMDAHVWAAWKLFVEAQQTHVVVYESDERISAW